ncbi:MAG TPA: histidine kinase, partial [Kofleriaceae bacterium]|nr:histidine kinase [Kofleriaceae bacterium]
MARKRELIYWICQIAGWSAFCGFGLLFVLFGRSDDPLWKFVITYGAGIPVAVAFAHLYRLYLRRRGWAALGLARLLPRMAAASAILGTIIAFTLAPIWFVVFDRVDPVGAWAPIAVLSWTWSVFMWSALYFGVHYFERWRQAEVDKLQLAVVAAEARLHGLMSQLNPHFLFNCLNSVRALIVEDPTKAQETVTALSNLMRYTLQAGRNATVPLETEIDMVETYLSLEGVRLDERLTSQIEIAPDTRSVPVPTMLVHLLVENGVKHGIERLP